MLLVDTESGRFLRLGPFGSVYGPLFSEDGARALWIAHERSGRRLRTADLRVSAPDISDHPLPLPGEPILGLALSADGSTIAVVQSRQVSVVPIGAERPVVAAHGGPGSVRQAVFTADGRVRALRRVPEAVGASGLEVIEIDPRTRRVSVGGEIATRGNPTEIWARGGELVVVLHRPDFRPSLTLHDGRDGRLLATPVAEGGAGRASMAFLADGRLAVVSATRSTDLHLFDGQGRLTATVQVAPWFALARVVPVGDDLLAVEVPYQADKTDTVLVEASTGRVLRREQGLQPGSRPRPWLGLPSAPTGDLFIDHRGALVRLDLATGDRNVILGGGDREF
jgi:hypothetical protein